MTIDYRVQAPGDELPEHPASDAGELVDAAVDEAFERRTGTVADSLHGQRLDKAVVAMAPEFSRSHLQGLIEGGHVSVGGVAVSTASRKVRSGQAIVVELVPSAESRAFRAEAIALDVVFEDAELLVLNKPAGMVVHPAAGNWSGTLLNALLAHHSGALSLPRAGIVHRLDKGTSGLMVVGKTLTAVTALVRAIAAREVNRQYQAIVHGEVRAASFSIEAPIGRDPQSRIRMAIVASGKPARTDVQVVARAHGFSALRCALHTGRTHQIRVHLASKGHVLVSDAVYGGAAALGLTRPALHAAHLSFVHPAGGEVMTFTAPLPPDLQAAWQQVAGPVG